MKILTMSGASRIILSCSGAADVGEIADRMARKLNKEGIGKMLCLAAISVPISNIVEATKSAQEVLVIDGCPVACALKCLDNAGIKVKAINLNNLGFIKGESPVSDAALEKAYNQVKEML